MNLVYNIVIVISGFTIVFIIKFWRRHFYRFAENSLTLLNNVLSNEDDAVKASKISSSIVKLSYSFLLILCVLTITLVTGIIPVFIYTVVRSESYHNLDLSSVYFYLSLSIGSLIPFFRIRSHKQESYTEVSKLLHRLTLNNYNVSKKLFSYDHRFKREPNIAEREDFVIISGLAQSGTTSLTSKLFDTRMFSSLNYSNMPFILAPNLWKKFYNPKDKRLRERSHQDGILMGLDTVEALDEYFFKSCLDNSYIRDNVLTEHDVTDDVYKKYLRYQSLIRTEESQRYLSKNNNFLLRYKSIRKRNKSFLMVSLFRDPLSHAHSLLSQHRKFIKLQEHDPFVLEYMNWLGHHEFGLNQKHFQFTVNSGDISGDRLTIDYWLKIWINYYSYLVTLDDENLIIINYKEYCSAPAGIINWILHRAGISKTVDDLPVYENVRDCDDEYSEKLLEQAMSLNEQLVRKTI